VEVQVTHDEIKAAVRRHVAQQFLAGEEPAEDTKLVSDGIVDSLGSLKLVSWLEERFGIKVEAHEVDVEHLDTLDSIAAMVTAKKR
jgi:acyl carrier protein